MQLSIKTLLVTVLVIGLIYGLLHVPSGNEFPVERIAHAGGALEGKTYTNSMEALELNFKKGFVYFEIDFLFTNDGHLVCGYDWEDDRGHIHWGGAPPSYEEFKIRTKRELPFTRCTLRSLMAWLTDHPAAFLITDIKDDNLSALSKIAKEYPELQHRIIPQIYYPEEFAIVRSMGYSPIIWTLYRIPDYTIEELLFELKNLEKPFAITLGLNWSNADNHASLATINAPLLTHTINLNEVAYLAINRGPFSEFYTDQIPPLNSKPLTTLCRKISNWNLYQKICIKNNS